MDKPVHILIVEDLKTDFDLAQHEIRKSVKDCVFQQVENRRDFLEALETFQPDVILSDYSLPRFNGMTALKLSLEHAPLTPFLIWTGSMSEDVAVECMKAGANNYILKENIKRLGPAVAHALDEGRLLLESKQADERLLSSEKRFRSLIENSLDNISLLAEDGTLLWENPAVNRTLGYEQDAFVGRNIFELMHPEDSGWTADTFQKLLKTPGGHERGTFRLKHQGGTWRWIEAIATNLLHEPSVGAMVINYRDVTEREQSQIEIEQRNDDLGLLNAINEAVIRGDGLDVIMKLLGGELKRIFSCESSIIFMLSPDEKFLTMQQYEMSPVLNRKIEQLLGGTIPLMQVPVKEGGTFQKALMSGRGMMMDDPDELKMGAAEFVGLFQRFGMKREDLNGLASQILSLMNTRSAISIPLISNEKNIGLLHLISSKILSENDLKRIENISRQLTAAIKHQQAAEKIQKSEEFLQSVQNALSASIAILNGEGTIVRVNSAWRKFGELNGLTHPEFGVGMNYLAICDSATGPYAEEAPSVATAIREVIAGQRREALIEYPCHSPREKRWFILHITRFEDGDQTWVVLAHENITERKLAEEAFREANEQLHTLFEASPEAIMLVDPRGIWKILDCNTMACSMNGYTREELVGQSINIFNLTPGESEERSEYLERIRKEGVLRYETLHRHKDGTIFPIEVSTSIISLGGREVVLGIDRDITERKQAETALRESEERFSNAFEYAPIGMAIVATDGRWLRVNQAMCRLVGYSGEELLQLTFQDITHPEDLELDMEYVRQMLASEIQSYQMEKRYLHKQGNIIWVLLSVSLVREEDGAPGYFIAQVQDINERKRTETALQASEERYRSLFEDVPIAIWEEDFSEVRKHIESLRQQGVSDFRAYFESHPESVIEYSKMIKVTDANRTALEMYEADDKESLIRETIQVLSKGEQANYVDDLVAIAEGKTSNSWEGTDETLGGKPIEINLNWSVVPGYEDDFSKVIVTTIDVTESKKAENELRASEERFRQLADNIQEVFWITDAGTQADLYLSPAYETLWGRPAELQYQNPDVFIQSILPEDRPTVLASMEKQRNGKRTEMEYRITRPDGTTRWVWDRAFPIFDKNGKVSRVTGIAADITERKLAEDRLRESEIRFAGVVNTAMDAVISVDSEQRIVLFNPAAERMFGCKASEALGESIDRFIPDRYRVAHRKHVTSFGETGMTNRAMGHLSTLKALRTNGTEFPIEASISHIEVGGQHLYTVILRDITERKQADEALRARDRLLSESQRIAQLGHYELNIQTGIWESSDILDEILGIDKTYPKDVDGWASLIHPAQREEMFNYFTQNVLEEHHVFDREYRIIRKSDQQERWVHGLGRLEYDNDKNLVRMIGTIQDITDRKEVAQALQQSEERYRQLLNVAPVGVGVHIDGKLVFANDTAARIFGANSPQELIGRMVMDFVHPEERQGTIQALQRMLKGETGLYPREERFIKLDGSVIHVEVTATPLTYMNTFAVQVIVQDITERKQAEKEIQRHLAELEALYENGLAVSRLLEPREIGERIINTFNRYLSWHHVTIRLLKNGSDELELVAFSIPHMKEIEREEIAKNFVRHISKVGQGMSGWVVQMGKPVRTGHVQDFPQYVETYAGIQSGLYMPLMIGEDVIGVISVESEESDAFRLQDERLLATLANQAAVAFENARLYQSAQQEIAERKRAEEALRIGETHYRELADSITDIFFELDQNLRYTHWNKASEMLTGVAAKDAIGKTMREIFGESDEQTRIGRIYENVLTSHQPRTFETVFTFHGEARSFEINAYPSTRGVSVVAKDVTDRKRSEIILQKRFELMEYSAQNSLDDLMRKTTDEVSELTGSEIGFFHFIEEDQVTPGMQTWSTNALELFHVPVSEGKHLPLDQAGVWAEAARKHHSIIHNDYESLPRRKTLPEGHVKVVREMVVPIIRNEKIKAVMGLANKRQEYTPHDLETAERFADYAWDITERKRMEVALADERNQLAKRVEERTAELIKANSNLARALRVKDEFLANMSHELRTPLNAILGLSESLAEQIAGPLNEKQQKYINTIGESGHHLLSLINDILDLAKIEAGQITLDINKVDINTVSQASLRMVKQLAQKKNQEILLNIDDDIGLIWADERRLKQMMVNLLSNAVKFTPENGQLGLDVHGNYDENRVEISVWDNGIGINEHDLQRLFQPFVQLDSGLARESTGTGLGLALVSQMARLHGGGVKVTSEPGKGSRFTITLPWEPALARDTVERLKNTGRLRFPETSPRNKKKILLIEDTIEVVMMISDYLEIAGYEVTTAQDGIEGVNQAKLMHPDLILMDIQMPRMDGFEATKKLRADPKFKYVPIIALTALAMPNDRERCIAAGMDEYISKPVNLRTLVKIIQKCLSAGEEKTRPV